MCSPSWLFRDEKHINVICYNTIFCTVVQAFCPQTVYKTGKIRVCGAMKSPVGTLSDRTVLQMQDDGASPRQVPVYHIKAHLARLILDGVGFIEIFVQPAAFDEPF